MLDGRCRFRALHCCQCVGRPVTQRAKGDGQTKGNCFGLVPVPVLEVHFHSKSVFFLVAQQQRPVPPIRFSMLPWAPMCAFRKPDTCYPGMARASCLVSLVVLPPAPSRPQICGGVLPQNLKKWSLPSTRSFVRPGLS